MTEEQEDAYVLGEKAAWNSVLRTAIGRIGSDDPDANFQRWRIEKSESIIALRSIALENGVDWSPESDYLPDIINELIRTLNANANKKE